MSDKDKILVLLIDAILSCADNENKERMAAFLRIQYQKGSCGDGSFDIKQKDHHNTQVDKAIEFVKNPGLLSNIMEN